MTKLQEYADRIEEIAAVVGSVWNEPARALREIAAAMRAESPACVLIAGEATDVEWRAQGDVAVTTIFGLEWVEEWGDADREAARDQLAALDARDPEFAAYRDELLKEIGGG